MLEIRLGRLRSGCRHGLSDCATVLDDHDSWLDMTTVVAGYSLVCVGICHAQWLVIYFANSFESL